MANRYRYSGTLKKPATNKRYLGSAIYPKVKADANDIYVIVDQSDRLDILALKYYGDQNYWWIIAIANNLNQASFYVEPGRQLRIPTNLSKILSDFQKLNN